MYVSSYLKQKFIKELFKSICYAGTGCCLEFMNTYLDIALLDMKKKKWFKCVFHADDFL